MQRIGTHTWLSTVKGEWSSKLFYLQKGFPYSRQQSDPAEARPECNGYLSEDAALPTVSYGRLGSREQFLKGQSSHSF